ncbi:hypothetical protein MPTK1_5g04720 [Marchantia polymorpha subsp. ruderalis]|uniref:Uncharacterized protein n=2 Tax=Marchantia polymorpha TaxID=3197 RepID=A0AAF6BEZ5_MARPO|nr:hypothetical protein MARPO_0027s0155 [Marchantia polymorpha]BBN10579.1 hypothetical protein Mp_5g04720 [Marchantia polymorpha subsp. ruderalis]|eukprot:PTQ43056.1 hypothetical protein MARPO_0027s0155 [Marchantia polymorpha]
MGKGRRAMNSPRLCFEHVSICQPAPDPRYLPYCMPFSLMCCAADADRAPRTDYGLSVLTYISGFANHVGQSDPSWPPAPTFQPPPLLNVTARSYAPPLSKNCHSYLLRHGVLTRSFRGLVLFSSCSCSH